MRARRSVTLIASVSLIVFMAASVLTLQAVDRIRPRAAVEDALYVASPKILKRASLGYDGLMACIYWTRTVQYFGHRHYERSSTYNELAPLLEITTSLDPHLLVAYEFGASFLAPKPPDGAGEPDRAIELVKYGIEQNPGQWHLYYDLGFVYYTELHDYAKAADAFARGSQIPDAHPFLKILAAQMAAHAGEFGTAHNLWMIAYQTTSDKNIKQNAIDHLRALRVDEDVTTLQHAVTNFGQRTGRLPASMSELIAAEHLPGVLIDPDGFPYRMTAEGRILVEHPDDFPFITTGTPPGYQPPSLNKHRE